MKKFIIAVLAVSVIGMFSMTASAAESVAGGFEASGHVMAGMGYQHQNNKPATEATFDDQYFSFAGPIGRYVNSAGPKEDHFEFFVDELELDLMKSFGENIRLRADIDFGRFNSGSNLYVGGGAIDLEQAYATANIPLGNGIEFMIGRFNVPIGFESVDASENDTISKSILIRSGIRPTNTTGAKFYYAFSDLVDLHFYLANRLTRDNMRAKINDIPSLGFRLGFNWGEQGNESTFGISAFFGPEHDVDSKKHFTMGTDLDLNWWVTESFALGLEGIFRKDNAVNAAAANMMTFGGLLNAKYLFSDVWDGTLKFAMANQNKANNGQWDFIGGGVKQSVYEVSLAGNYAIADGAKLKLEGRGDILKPSGGGTQYVYGGALAFAYDF